MDYIYVKSNVLLLLLLKKMDGGPPLTYHHEMCVDPVGRKLYVLGGRILTPEPSVTAFSGFYSYDMDKSQWQMLR